MLDPERWGIVYSPQFSLANTHKRWKTIRKHLKARGIKYDYVQTESPDSVERLVAMMCLNGYHTIVVVGNDAALNDAVNAMMNNQESLPSDFAFSIIPNGTGNDFARFWTDDINNHTAIIDAIQKRKHRLIDVASCVYNDDGIPVRRYFINCINIGLGARLVKITNDAASIIGTNRIAYLHAFIRHIFKRRLFNASLQIDTEHIDGTYMSMCIGNCHGYGQTPNAVPYNGMLDVSLITRPEWWQLFEGFWLLGKSRFLNYKNVHPYRAKEVTLTNIGRASVSFDGMPLSEKSPEPLRVSVVPEALRFIMLSND